MAQISRRNIAQSTRLRRLGLIFPKTSMLVLCVLMGVIVAVVVVLNIGSKTQLIHAANAEDDTLLMNVQHEESSQSSEEADARDKQLKESDASVDQKLSGQASSQSSQVITVHVDGAVHNPGIQTLTAERCRVHDAVTAAGGLLESADTTQVNLAAQLSDGEKIYIPHEGEVAVSLVAGDTQGMGDSVQQQLVNINTASLDELCTLSGVGKATAEAIIHERQSAGPFESIEDLMRVSGIGEKKFQKLRDSICV